MDQVVMSLVIVLSTVATTKSALHPPVADPSRSDILSVLSIIKRAAFAQNLLSAPPNLSLCGM